MPDNTKSKPVYRIGFAPYNGHDRSGQPVLDYPIEIGACFAHKDASKGLVAKLKIIPANLSDGVILLLPPLEQRSDNPELDV